MPSDSLWSWRDRTPEFRQVAIEPGSPEAYATYRRTPEGARLYSEFVRLALQLKRGGFGHYTAQGIVESIRMNRAIKLGPKGQLKVNNNHAAYLAREAMDMESELRHFFETRRSRADVPMG